tara:strand:+ start:91 stop:732 length:642 start_codon:yes stop_codon:yes gene_type:complete
MRLSSIWVYNINMNRICTKCKIEKPITFFSKHTSRKDRVQPYCKSCVSAYDKKYHKKHSEKKAKAAREWAQSHKKRVYLKNKAWVSENKEKVNAYKKVYRDNNKDKEKIYRKQYLLLNPEKIKAGGAKHRAAKLNASVSWANKFFIEEIYDLAIRRSKATGFQWHVDHIIPLQNPIVCGLHCEQNLQVIPAVENLKKGNLFADVSSDIYIRAM